MPPALDTTRQRDRAATLLSISTLRAKADAAGPAMVPTPCQQWQADAGAGAARSAHTPGPWIQDVIFILDVSGKRIADACGVDSSPAREFANAKLISAAPDLLAAAEARRR